MILAISGGRHAGKDTFFDTIKERYKYNYNFIQKKFSYNMKLCACIIFGWTMEQIEDQTFKETIDPIYGISPRMFLDDFGTIYGRQHLCEVFPEFKRLVGERIWSMGTIRDCVKEATNNNIVCITDFRYPVEEVELESCNHEVIVLNIDRPEFPINPKSADKLVPLLEWNYKLINNKSLEEYRDDCISMFDKIMEDRK